MSVCTILYRNIKWRFHNPLTLIITILQPVLWLALYSTVAGQTMKGTGIENYTAFILPGLIVLVSFSVCSSSGIMNYMMKTDGSFYRILIAPVSRVSIVLGQILEAVLCTFLEVAVMAALSLLFSVRVFPNPKGIMMILILIFLTAFFMSGLSYSISLILPNEVVFEMVMNAIVLPVFSQFRIVSHRSPVRCTENSSQFKSVYPCDQRPPLRHPQREDGNAKPGFRVSPLPHPGSGGLWLCTA